MTKTLAINKKALFDYEILERFEAGVILQGEEIKSLRNQGLTLKGSFIFIKNAEAWVENLHIPRYKYSSNESYDPLRKRKLLLNKAEITKLALQSEQKGITIIPLEIMIKNRKAKLNIGIGRGKKKHDKRELLKKRSQEMEIRKTLKKYRY
ncbi:SsrA-binding protein SmpB [Candidatus Peregrinibacteria bacterium]|nr:SsrA-binding protein SmpB [Candidatus Peregrinibacteria bacterium]